MGVSENRGPRVGGLRYGRVYILSFPISGNYHTLNFFSE